ncbi:hypothetical protein ACFFWC_18770 [Plantactinospora siamensis]|uniref:Anti-sigma-D factor RsdA sigma factor binding region domain-containing protein n=1 Tax=Plantactinospora siamensis TaxID=555372 RepID=A0ABV6P3A0_9ACTN
MNEHIPTGDGQPVEPMTLTEDDLLLDALGSGGEPPADDPVAALLSAWRAELDADGTLDTDGTLDADGTLDTDGMPPSAPAATEPGAGGRAGEGPTGSTGPTRGGAAVPSPRRRTGPGRAGPARWRRRSAVAVAAAVVAVSGLGLAVGSHRAGPTSPLWTLTRLLYPQEAQVRDVEYTLDRAEAALAAGRYGEARGLLDKAAAQLPGLSDRAAAARLAERLAALRRRLPAEPPVPGSPAGPSAAPRPSAARSASGGTPRATNPPSAAPHAPPSGRGRTPSPGPLLPLPSLPASPGPVPSLLPTQLPKLPLPTGRLLG